MDNYQKYIKYKQKYLKLKNEIQLGGTGTVAGFYFAVYVFSKEPLDQIREYNIINLLKSLYGGEIGIDITGKQEYLSHQYVWNVAIDYIKYKGGYPTLKYITAFLIINVPSTLTTGKMNDAKLLAEENRIISKLNNFNLITLDHPHQGGNDFSRGWGFSGDGIAVVTLVEKEL
jgi:hypothetical protein